MKPLIFILSLSLLPACNDIRRFDVGCTLDDSDDILHVVTCPNYAYPILLRKDYFQCRTVRKDDPVVVCIPTHKPTE